MFFTTARCLTANNTPEGLCGIELTMIRNSRIYKQQLWLFCPPKLYMENAPLSDPRITLADLVDSPKLYEIWDEITPYFDRQLLIFHQLPENIRAFTKALSYYGLNAPHFTFGSTMMLAKRLYPMLPNVKLSTLCKYFSIPQENDHEKIASTLEMAKILLTIGKQFNISDEEALFAKAGIYLGSYQSDGICYPDFLSHYTPPILAASCDDCPAFDTNLLRNQVITLTGPLETMTRAMAVKKLTALGAHYQSQINAKTTLVVTNLYDPHTHETKRLTSKLNKALILKGQGQNISIINETQFIERLKQS